MNHPGRGRRPKFALEVMCDGPAFAENWPAEVALILADAARTLPLNEGLERRLVDSNGNAVGRWVFHPGRLAE